MSRVRRDNRDHIPVQFGELGIVQISIYNASQNCRVTFIPLACDRRRTYIQHEINSTACLLISKLFALFCKSTYLAGLHNYAALCSTFVAREKYLVFSSKENRNESELDSLFVSMLLSLIL